MIGPPPDAAVAAFGKRVFLMNFNKGAGSHHRDHCRGHKYLLSGCEFNITLDPA